MTEPSKQTPVKVCGVRTAEDLVACVESGADYVGFNFAPESKRRIDPGLAAELVARLPEDGPVAVGVFRDQPAGDVMRIAKRAGVAVVQLHGDESPAFCSALGGFDLWKALSGPEVSRETMARYAMWCDALLVDGREPGSGNAWDFARVAPLLDDDGTFDGAPVFVAGGLTPDNVAAALAASHAAGADVASGVETDGVMDPKRVAAFVAAARGRA